MKTQGIIQLRRLLAERFPHARTWTETSAPRTNASWPTGLPEVDEPLQGGLPKGAITELVGPETNAGSALLLQAILCQAAATRQLAALVDGQDSFDATALEQPVLSRLLWVRCKNADEALKATDILLRDRNLSLVILDLKMNPAAQLRKIAGTVWFRLQRIVQQGATAFLVLTPHPMVGSTDARLSLESRFAMSTITETEETLLPKLRGRGRPLSWLKLELTRWNFGETASESKIAD